ncbi:hypothetical protein GCM10009646_69930 [Streptomyces aureus]
MVEDPEAILASNTSSIPIMKLAGATGRPAQVMGTHFLNPVPAMPLVELVSSLHTSDASMDRAESRVAQTLGKQPIRSKDRAGFVVNALLVPYLLSAVRMTGARCVRPVSWPWAPCACTPSECRISRCPCIFPWTGQRPLAPLPIWWAMSESGPGDGCASCGVARTGELQD